MGRGSSLPGQIALKIYPGVLGRLKLPDTIIAVTGSNGKTSTAEFITRALEANGKSVGLNHEGANQIEGVATLFLRIATFRGVVKRDAMVLECDERYTRMIFKAVRPSALVVTNLCRDQLTRNGHHEFIQDCIRAAIEECRGGGSPDTLLVLNADDPYVASLADAKFGMRNSEFGIEERSEEPVTPFSRGNRFVWFGMSREMAINSEFRIPNSELFAIPNSEFKAAQPLYDDGAFCPVCKSRMTYEYRIAGHYGAYACNKCGLSRPKPDIEVTALDNRTGVVTIVPDSLDSVESHLKLPSLVGAYNLAAAVATAAAVGVNVGDAARALDGYELVGGRTVRFSSGKREGILLVSKHENSLSYNQSLAWVTKQDKPCTVIVLVDSISRKYYTGETSWLWDVDFDILADDCVKSIVLAGRYSNELMARFAMSSIDPGKIGCAADLAKLCEHVQQNTTGDIYALTCFADKMKLLKAFSA